MDGFDEPAAFENDERNESNGRENIEKRQIEFAFGAEVSVDDWRNVDDERHRRGGGEREAEKGFINMVCIHFHILQELLRHHILMFVENLIYEL